MYKSATSLTNNFRANVVVLTVSLVAGAGLALFYPDLILAQTDLAKADLFELLVIFTGVYIVSSYWFSPDLDVYINRPGKHSFPLGPVIRLFCSGSYAQPTVRRRYRAFRGLISGVIAAVLPLHLLLNRCWNLYWQPFAALFTHRGAVHWPFIGTNLKILYIYISLFLANLISETFLKIPLPLVRLGFFDGLFSSGGLFELIGEDRRPLVAYLAWLSADICHSGVDLWDSVKAGKRFVPPPMIAPRGLFSRLLAELSKNKPRRQK